MKRFLCVILVFTLFIACTVRPAYAVDVGTVSVALEAFISAALIGLGLSPQAGNNTAFNQIVSNCKAWLQTATIDGLEILSTASGLALSLISPVDGAFYVKKNVIEGIKDWLFDSGSVSANYAVLSGSTGSWTFKDETYGYLNATDPVYFFPVCWSDPGYYKRNFAIFMISEGGFSTDSSVGTPSAYRNYGLYNGYYVTEWYRSYTTQEVNRGYTYIGDISNTQYNRNTVVDYLITTIPGYSSIIVPDGISVSDVVPQVGEDIEITYIDWKELEKQVQEGDGSSEDPTDPTNPAPIPLVPYWPIWSPQFSNPDSTLDDVTQSDVWQSGSDPNWNPGNSGENSESSPDIPSLTIDLRKFFPFCIPFDIYDIFVAFAADPVAPHFQWDIDIWDYTWSIDLDLSAWDEVAAILRRLELLAFIVGLGVVTRDKFLRG